MPTLHLLGTGSANSTPDRTTTMLAVSYDRSTLLIDCGGDVLQRALAAGLTLDSVDGLIVTHEHPDHVGGFPLFIEKLWLAKRNRPISVYGIKQAIDQADRCWRAYDTSRWAGVPDIEWHEVAYTERASVLDDDNWSVTASPGVHGVPVIGVRVRSKVTGGTMAYSCDTEPCQSIARLSNRADILVHEANGEGPGHTSICQATTLARDAGAGRLILVHLPASESNSELTLGKKIFERTDVGVDLAEFAF